MDYFKTASTEDIATIMSLTVMNIIIGFIGWGFIGVISMVSFLGLMLLLAEKYA